MSRLSQQSVKDLVTKMAAIEPAKRPITKIVYDSEVPGFCVRLRSQADGNVVATYTFDYYFGPRSEKCRKSIGKSTEITADSARAKAREFRALVKNKIDPRAEDKAWKEEPTFAALAVDWLKYMKRERLKRDSSLYDDRRMLGVDENGDSKADGDAEMQEKRILTVLGDMRVKEIKQEDIQRLRDMYEATPYQANRVLALVSAIFGWGVDKKNKFKNVKWKKWITENPAEGIARFNEEKRERWLTVEELQKFREALDKYKDKSAANALRLLLLTGSRAGEVLRAEWREFDLSRGVWTKPSHHTKQKKTEHIPLSADAVRMLEAMAPENPAGPLFPGTRRKGKDGVKTGGEKRVSLKRPWLAACRAAGLVEHYLVDGKRRTEDGTLEQLDRYRPTVRVHDLRHNFASHLASNGVSLQVVGKLLGHTQASTTMRYAHLQDAPLRDAANQFGRIFADTPKVAKRRG